MNIQKMSINELTPAYYNPRKDLQPDDAEYIKLKRSIETFGYVDPVIYNEQTGTVVGGHQRLKVLKDLGYDEIDVNVIDITEQKEKALNVALNKISGEFDMPLLTDLLHELDAEDFDITLTGFELDDLDFGDGEVEEDDFDVDEAMPEEAKTKLGDIYQLGDHRLMCGDSISQEDVDKLMNGNKADMVFTDPPYGVSYKNNMNDKFEVLENDDVFLDVIPILENISKNNIHWYIWTSHQVYPTWRDMVEKYYKNTIIWSKGGGGLGDLEGNYATDYEMSLFCHYGRKELHGKREGAVWNIGKDAGHSYQHPTQKPIELAFKAVSNSSSKGELVVDLFGGSGSTLMASEQLGRTCHMMELDEKYCDVIIARYEYNTGKEAVLLNED